MAPQLLLDAHVLVRWLVEPKRLSRDKIRALRSAIRRGEPLGLSAITLIESALLFGEGSTRLRVPLPELFAALDSSAGFHVVPIDVEIAAEVAALEAMPCGILRAESSWQPPAFTACGW